MPFKINSKNVQGVEKEGKKVKMKGEEEGRGQKEGVRYQGGRRGRRIMFPCGQIPLGNKDSVLTGSSLP